MSNSQKLSKMSVEDYLRIEESANTRHEYIDGEVFAMTGGTLAHSLIATNISAILKSQLKGSGCRVYVSDAKVRIDATNSFYYPDVLVDCGAYEKSHSYTETPAVIFEVLSPSTASIDRREKLVAYKRLPSLRSYVIVQQARKRLAIYFRDDEDNWTLQEIGTKEEFVLELSPGKPIKVDIDEVYADTDIEDNPNLQVREDVEVYAW